MGDELSGLLEIFTKVKEAGGQATLTAATHEGKTKIKLEIVSPPTTSATGFTSLPAAATAPASGGGRRRRRRAQAARKKANAQVAQHQAATPATGEVVSVPLLATIESKPGGAPPPDPVSLIDFDPLLRVPPAPAPVAPWGMPSSPPGEEPSPHSPTVNSTIARLTPCIICTASVYSHNEILAKLGKQYCRPCGDALIRHRVHPSIAL